MPSTAPSPRAVVAWSVAHVAGEARPTRSSFKQAHERLVALPEHARQAELVRSERRRPDVGLEGKPGNLDGRELHEVAADDHLDAAEGPRAAARRAPDGVDLVQESPVNH